MPEREEFDVFEAVVGIVFLIGMMAVIATVFWLLR